MNVLFANEELVKQYGENAKKQANELYASEVYYKRINDIYEKILNTKGE